MGSRISRYGLGLLAVAAALIAVVSVAALAAPTITEYPLPALGGAKGPEGITVGPDGNIWFVETTANAIGRLNPDGTVDKFPGVGTTGTIGSNAGLAEIVSGPDGALYFTESNRDRIGRITADGLTITESSPIRGGTQVQGLTVGPDNGLWFAEPGQDRVGRMAPGATPTLTNEYQIMTGGNQQPYDITTGPDGNLWFTEHVSGGNIGRITPDGLSITEASPAVGGLPTSITAGPDGRMWFTDGATTGAIRAITTSLTAPVSYTTGLTHVPLDIAAGDDGSLWFTENAAGGRVGQVTTAGTITEYGSGSGLSSPPYGVTRGADGNVWFSENGADAVGRMPLVAGSATGAATAIGPTSATLAGTVTPRAQATTYVFEWGTTTAYGASTPSASAGSGTGGTPATAVLGGLLASTTYHYRLVSTNASGTTYGADASFTTTAVAPDATTGAAGGVDAGQATLAGVVNGHGSATTYHFELGTTSAYGRRMPASEAAVSPTDGSDHAVQEIVAGLDPSTTYHYRLVATSPAGTAAGVDHVFTTSAAPVATPVAATGPTLPPATRPVLGRSATIAGVSGEVLVTLPGGDTSIPLTAASTVPVGSTIDASNGRLRLTSVRDRRNHLQTATFWGGAFVVRQPKALKPMTVISLAAKLDCGLQTASASNTTPKVRQLWGKDTKGRFVTRGRAAVATVRGTAWLTRDTCKGTLVQVTKGVVSVRDLVRKRTLLVRAGHRYLARTR
jgi:streptogramin lyase